MKTNIIAHLGSNWIGADMSKFLRECQSADALIVNAFDPNLYREKNQGLSRFVIPDDVFSQIVSAWKKPLIIAPYSSKKADEFGGRANGFYISPGHVGNTPLLTTVGKYSLPILLDISAVFLEEIEVAIDTLSAAGAGEISLIYGIPEYPAPFRNLRPMINIASKFIFHQFGYCDNNNSITMSIVAMAMGANVIIKTIDTSAKKGADAHFSVSGEQLSMLATIRDEFSISGDWSAIEQAFRKTRLVCLPDYQLPPKDG